MTLFDAIYGDAYAAAEAMLARTPLTAGQLRALLGESLTPDGRGGRITRIDWELFRYEVDVTDTMEMMRWVRTFTGRIEALRDDSGQVDGRFRADMERMREMYGGKEDGNDAL